MVHFWIVEVYYPNRVMRQLGYFQKSEPDPPISWEDTLKFRKVKHNANHKLFNWKDEWFSIVEHPGIEIHESRPYSEENYYEYLQWYWKNGMHTIYMEEETDDALNRPLPQTAPDEVENHSYVSHSKFVRLVQV